MSILSNRELAERSPAISVVVPCRNEILHIEDCVRSLLAQATPPGGFEFLIVDGMSNDGTRDVLARLCAEVNGLPSTAAPTHRRTDAPLPAPSSDISAFSFQLSALKPQPPSSAPVPSDSGFQLSAFPISASASAIPHPSESAPRSVAPAPSVSPRPSSDISAFNFQLSALKPQPPSSVLRVIDNPAGITPCGMNCGIRPARGRWIAIMGAHSRYAPDYLVRCLEVAQATAADNVGGAMYCEGESLVEKAIGAAHHSPFSVGGARWHNPDYEGSADTVFGGFYKREVFERIGLFDEELVRNQDDEFNLRLTRAGGTIWHSPKIKSWYRPRGSLSALFRQYLQYGYWKVRVIQKHKLPASWRHLIPGTFVLTLAVLFLLSTFCLPWPVKSFSYFTGQLSAVCFLAILSAYTLALITASLITAARTEWKLFPLLPLVFPCYHFGYGWGFLRGILDFVLLRRGASTSFSKLTRGSPEPKGAGRSGL